MMSDFPDLKRRQDQAQGLLEELFHTGIQCIKALLIWQSRKNHFLASSDSLTTTRDLRCAFFQMRPMIPAESDVNVESAHAV